MNNFKSKVAIVTGASKGIDAFHEGVVGSLIDAA
jgi:NADP-dependent 3-hydroxy acid dehydrogenase YdfG